MNQFQMIVLICCTCCCWAYNRYEPSYVHFELDSDEINDDDDDDDHHQGMPYGFQYDVNDGYDNNFGHWQKSDGQVTTGSYRVQLPDGRTQIVTYRADENGYNAQVTYEPAAITTTTPAPAPPVKSFLFSRTTNPFYEFPGIPPYHGPTNVAYGAYQQQSTSSNSYGGGNSYYYETADATTSAPYSSADGSEDSDESITENPITPLLYRNNVDKISSSNLYGDISRIPLVYRSSKRSPPSSIDVWSEQQEPQGAVNISKALDTTREEEEEQFAFDENDESQTDFDQLPFPLPLPLAFRPV